MRLAFRLVLALGLMLGASSAFAQPRGTDYFPLNKGAKWTYKVADNDVEVFVAGVERVGDEDCVRLDTRVGTVTKTTELFAVRADGVYRVKVKNDAIVPPVKVLPIPAKAGDAWELNSKIGLQSVKGTFTVKSDREKVKVPAGEFDAVLVEAVDLDIAGAKTTVRIWFAKGRGIVKEEFVLQGGEAVILELAKFEPGELPPPPATRAVPAWAFSQPCRILPVQRIVLPVTTQECCGCCARSGRLFVRRR
jgi:hypothetical protein